jgi:F-type H+-transporting ATPase subunit b
MDLLLPHLGIIVWTVLVFGIVFFILKKFAWPMIMKGLDEREKSIAASLESAEKLKVEMAQMKSENETLMAKAREERSAMLKEAKEVRDKMISDAKEEAKVAAAKIITDAQAIINQQKNAALIDLKNQVGNLVIEVSEKVIRRELTNRADQENYISQLAGEVKLN